MRRGTPAPTCSAVWHGGACNRTPTARGLCPGHYVSVHVRGKPPGPLRGYGEGKCRRPPLRLPDGHYDALAGLARARGVTLGALHRQAVQDFLGAAGAWPLFRRAAKK